MDEIFAHPQAPLTRRFVETVVPQRLPDSLSEEVRDGKAGTVVRLVHTGGAARTVLRDVEKQFDVQAALLHASDAPLRHTTVGTMVLGLTGPGAAVSHTLEWLAEQPGLTVEVLP